MQTTIRSVRSSRYSYTQHLQHQSSKTSNPLKMSKKTVLMTGFGDFATVKGNLSWLGVDSMDQDHIERTYDIIFYKKKIEVSYKAVDSGIPKLLAELQPDLIINCGLHETSPGFRLETQANKRYYKIHDNEGLCPPNNVHSTDGPDTIKTDMDVVKLCELFNATPKVAGLTAAVSNDAGLFVCEYIYYATLAHRRGAKALFVHVPGKGFTKEQIAIGLERILEICLKMM
ncbi:hypothetical protein PYW08_005347 [Mythimna loreyi]|uniref:Uncharacterized protein n=1 Tax=Mythimna loreyi TaxID=667449 RepID=A0ACC2QLE5_9NEOP|nr:hypothetical protein PYW08_005347 [Mythimna loreyi]